VSLVTRLASIEPLNGTDRRGWRLKPSSVLITSLLATAPACRGQEGRKSVGRRLSAELSIFWRPPSARLPSQAPPHTGRSSKTDSESGKCGPAKPRGVDALAADQSVPLPARVAHTFRSFADCRCDEVSVREVRWEQLGNNYAQTPGKTGKHGRPETKARQQDRQSGPVCKTSIPGSNPGGASKILKNPHCLFLGDTIKVLASVPK
jgi:hypothetical protein